MRRILILTFLLAACRPSSDETLKAAREFASHIPENTGVACQDFDSDGDGYVSCTVFRGAGDPIFIECPAALSFNSQCRGQKASTRR